MLRDDNENFRLMSHGIPIPIPSPLHHEEKDDGPSRFNYPTLGFLYKFQNFASTCCVGLTYQLKSYGIS